MPSTNAVSELSFSTLKQVKTYLRSTMGETTFNHKENADGIDMVEATAERGVIKSLSTCQTTKQCSAIVG